MKRQIAYLMVMSSVVLAPLAFTTGCAVTSGRESAGEYAKDKEIAARVKTRLYADPTTKGTEIEVQSLRGTVQLSGFVENQAARNRAGEIAASTPGVVQVYNNLLLPTGR
ncbi:MAG TPA: BON domain-containing protein [Patescibacteria group bacterium]|nr:BON domain-containing protein [Patescibacteria group bacterium]